MDSRNIESLDSMRKTATHAPVQFALTINPLFSVIRTNKLPGNNGGLTALQLPLSAGRL